MSRARQPGFQAPPGSANRKEPVEEERGTAKGSVTASRDCLVTCSWHERTPLRLLDGPPSPPGGASKSATHVRLGHLWLRKPHARQTTAALWLYLCLWCGPRPLFGFCSASIQSHRSAPDTSCTSRSQNCRTALPGGLGERKQPGYCWGSFPDQPQSTEEAKNANTPPHPVIPLKACSTRFLLYKPRRQGT